MFKVRRRTSVMISIFYSAFLFIVAAAGAVTVPSFVNRLIDVSNSLAGRDVISGGDRVILYILAYLALAVIVGINVLIIFLLFRVGRGKVFTAVSIALMRYISWGGLLLAAVFCGLAFFFSLSLIFAFATVFISFCLRVIKNILEEATEIKSENDLTV